MNKYLVGLLLVSLLAACHKKAVPANNTDNIATDKLLFEQPQVAYVVISIKRTSCFGKCPAYEANIYSDGKVSYKGISNVEMKGNYVSTMNATVINSLIKKAYEIKYFDMAEVYPVDGERIADLPTAITSITCTGHSKKINDKYKAPDSLIKFEEQIDLEIYKLKYKTTDPQQ